MPCGINNGVRKRHGTVVHKDQAELFATDTSSKAFNSITFLIELKTSVFPTSNSDLYPVQHSHIYKGLRVSSSATTTATTATTVTTATTATTATTTTTLPYLL